MITEFEIFEKVRLNNQKDLNDALLRYSRQKESLSLIRKLLYLGADVNCRNTQKMTPLLIAASSHFYSAVKLLIEKGADVNAVDGFGNNALMLLAFNSRFGDKVRECIDLLIENGIDLTHTDDKGIDIFSIMKFYATMIQDYIKEKYPEQYEEYLLKRDAKKYNL